MKDNSCFIDAGKLKRPGPIGRLVRLSLGLVCGWFFVFLIVVGPAQVVSQFPYTEGIWLWVVVALYLFSYVINIGFHRQWGQWPQVAILAGALMASFIGYVAYDDFWGSPLAWFLIAWLSYFSAHLGISFVLSSILATPGCEMRSISHLLAVISNRSLIVHQCPVAPLSRIDAWEANRKIASKNKK